MNSFLITSDSDAVLLISHRSQWVMIIVTKWIYLLTTLSIFEATSTITPTLSYLMTTNNLFKGPSVKPARIPIEWASLSDEEPNPGVSMTLNPKPSQDSLHVIYFVID